MTATTPPRFNGIHPKKYDNPSTEKKRNTLRNRQQHLTSQKQRLIHGAKQKNSREDSVDDAEPGGEGGVTGELLQHGAGLTHGPEVRQLELAGLAGALVLHLQHGVADLVAVVSVSSGAVDLFDNSRRARSPTAKTRRTRNSRMSASFERGWV